MRALKIAVIAMGALLVVGLVLLVVGLMNRFGGVAEHLAGTPAPAVSVPGATPRLTLPSGSTIQEMRANGTQVTLLLRLDDRRHRLIALDVGTGALLGTVDLAAD